MNSKTLMSQLAGAAGDDKIQISASDYAQLQNFSKAFDTCLASLSDLSEPFKTEFSRVKQEINQVLAGLAPTDQVPAAAQADNILRQFMSMLKYTQDMMTQLTNVAKNATEGQRTALASLTTQVEAEANKKLLSTLASGEYVKKDEVATKISDAIAAARSKWDADAKVVAERRQTLASANILVPDDSVLQAEDFDARKTKATERLTKLKPFTALKPERVTQLCWNVDDAAFNSAVGDMEAALGKKPSGNPLATGGSAAAAAATAGDKNFVERARSIGVL